jgi:hypothetical protein
MRVMNDTDIIILLDICMCLGEILLDSTFRMLSIGSVLPKQALLEPSLDSKMNKLIPPREQTSLYNGRCSGLLAGKLPSGSIICRAVVIISYDRHIG